jgi:putative membrane protein
MGGMRTLVLCIDRDNDIGVKAGIPGPIIGRRDNLDAAMKLGLADPEDADVNTMLTAVSKYDDLQRNGIDAEVATISGDIKVGDVSDREIVRQLEEVLDEVRPDTAFLVSDGAEDEFVFPLITSRLKVDHVRRVFVKQQQSIESMVSVVTKTLRDEKWRKRLLIPPSVILLAMGIILMIPIALSIMAEGITIATANALALPLILLILGFTLLYIAYPVSFSLKRGIRRVRDSYDDAKDSVMSGDVTVFFNLVATILVLLGTFFGIDAARKADNLVQTFFFFLGGFIWLFITGIFIHELGKILVVVIKKREFPKSFGPVTIFFLVVVIITLVAIDALSVVLGIEDPADIMPTMLFNLALALVVLVIGTIGWRSIERKAPPKPEWRR